MNERSRFEARFLSASEYVLASHEPADNVAVLLRHRASQTLQRIASAETIASPDFSAGWPNKIAPVPTCMLRGIELVFVLPFAEAEANAVVDGVNAFEKLLAELSDFLTPGGPTPRQLPSGLVQTQPTNEGSK